MAFVAAWRLQKMAAHVAVPANMAAVQATFDGC